MQNISQRQDGGTTVSGTIIGAVKAGIRIFATGRSWLSLYVKSFERVIICTHAAFYDDEIPLMRAK
jgi:hypothetical protein